MCEKANTGCGVSHIEMWLSDPCQMVRKREGWKDDEVKIVLRDSVYTGKQRAAETIKEKRGKIQQSKRDILQNT